LWGLNAGGSREGKVLERANRASLKGGGPQEIGKRVEGRPVKKFSTRAATAKELVPVRRRGRYSEGE